ncbi:hypothetical protein LCGC14_0502790 [marine sediment metagenome]|uniref:Nucleotide-diphospho-sugar transferase domain-containing protein n=1 Tax=marine sediment metagenome TaxID=412755 RepID=A0A0F9UQ98_9ZZZZ
MWRLGKNKAIGNKVKLITVYFARSRNYKNFLTVWLKSAKKIMPNIDIKVIKPKQSKCIDHKRDTAIAFNEAAYYALKSKEPLIITDVDMMFMNPVDTILDRKFDIAITVRKYRAKYNTGLWIYKPSKRSRKFVHSWIQNTKWIVENFNKCTELIGTHGGIDQASLWMTINKIQNINILELPCQVWNACQTEWEKVDRHTKIIHVKSKLRLTATGRNEVPENMQYLKPLIKKWRSYL